VAVVLATRRSPLALAQTELVADDLRASGEEVSLLPITTTGDRWSATGGEVPGKGVFVKELEQALLDGAADLAVHSAKDVPADLPEGLALLGVGARADARDVVVGAPGGLLGLPLGARIATGSPRRAAQIAEARPDLAVVDIRGNVGTRITKLRDGHADALVLAAAGLERLQRDDVARAPLPVQLCTPAPGQGYLALEGRVDDGRVAGLLARITADADRTCLDIERGVLSALGGGCRTAVGAYCEPTAAGLWRLTVYERREGSALGSRVQVEGGEPGALIREATAAVRAAA
jgi:hydroxymethylbilane synthase